MLSRLLTRPLASVGRRGFAAFPAMDWQDPLSLQATLLTEEEKMVMVRTHGGAL